MFRYFVAVSLFIAINGVAIAQQVPAQQDMPILVPHTSASEEWPSTADLPVYVHSLDIVTSAKPGHSQSCHVQSITADAIICRAAHHKEIAYQREDIVALIDPPYHGDRLGAFVLVGVAAASLAGSFFVPLAASVVLRIFIYPFLGLAAFGGNADHNSDRLIYHRPDAIQSSPLHS